MPGPAIARAAASEYRPSQWKSPKTVDRGRARQRGRTHPGPPGTRPPPRGGTPRSRSPGAPATGVILGHLGTCRRVERPEPGPVRISSSSASSSCRPSRVPSYLVMIRSKNAGARWARFSYVVPRAIAVVGSSSRSVNIRRAWASSSRRAEDRHRGAGRTTGYPAPPISPGRQFVDPGASCGPPQTLRLVRRERRRDRAVRPGQPPLRRLVPRPEPRRADARRPLSPSTMTSRTSAAVAPTRAIRRGLARLDPAADPLRRRPLLPAPRPINNSQVRQSPRAAAGSAGPAGAPGTRPPATRMGSPRRTVPRARSVAPAATTPPDAQCPPAVAASPPSDPPLRSACRAARPRPPPRRHPDRIQLHATRLPSAPVPPTSSPAPSLPCWIGYRFNTVN